MDILINEAGRNQMFPLYVFYNWWDTYEHIMPWNCKAVKRRNSRLLGCGIAEARALKSLLNGTKENSAEKIAEIMYPWSCLVCCNGCSVRSNVSLPQRAFQFLSNTYGDLGGFEAQESKYLVKQAPQDIERLIIRKEKTRDFNVDEWLTGYMLEKRISGITVIKEVE